MDADLDTFATELYVPTDDLPKAHPEQCPARPLVGLAPQISDAEMISESVADSAAVAILPSLVDRERLDAANGRIAAA